MQVKFISMKDHSSVEVRIDGEHYTDLKVHTDPNGHEYVQVPNLFRREGDVLTKGSFSHRIGDMVQHIRNGWGDVIEHMHLIVHHYTLIRYLDREHGEKLRKQSIDGWKDAEFGWAVFMRNSLFGDDAISVLGSTKPLVLNPYLDDAEKVHTQFYDSGKDGQAFIDKLLTELKPIADEYYSIASQDENDPRLETLYKEKVDGLPLLKRLIFDHHEKGDIMKSDLLYVGQIIKRNKSPFQEKKIFTTYSSWNTMDGYMCQGDARDYVGDDYIYEEVLRFKLDAHEQIFGGDASECTIYRIEHNDDHTDWYRRIDECFNDPKYKEVTELAKRCGCTAGLRSMILHKQTNLPIEPSPDHPFQMLISQGKRGLVGSANLRPDEVGKYTSRKKFYFPDRSCASTLCAGMVNVTKVMDRGNYGFFIGEMVRYESPEEGDDFSEFLLDNFAYSGELQIQFVHNRFWGSAVRLTNRVSKVDRYIAIDPTDGKISTISILDDYNHSEDIADEEPVSIQDYLCNGYTGKSFNELCDMVTTRCSEFYKYYPFEHPETFYSEDFDRVVDSKLIELCRLGNFNFCLLNPNYMCEAAFRVCEGLPDVLKKVEEINQEAKVKFANLRRKGKI